MSQSNYIPWKGYFDLIRLSDEFILYDSVQYTRRDWRNRNVIKTQHGPVWLTIPVQVKSRYLQAIDETRIAEPRWYEQHWKTVETSYARAASFEETAPWVREALKAAAESELLSDINEALIRSVCDRLRITTPIRRCTDLLDRDEMRDLAPTERLVRLCVEAGAGVYLTGPAAKSYLDVTEFSARGIEVEWMEYTGYPEYPQLWGDFVHEVSIIDLLLNVGSAAPQYLAAGSRE